MTAATHTTTMTDLYTSGDVTGWSRLGGAPDSFQQETDYFVQGSACISKNAFASDRKGLMFDSVSDRAATIGTDGAVLIWTTHAAPGELATIANGGIAACVGHSASDYSLWHVGGSDTIAFMGWILAAVNPSETPDEVDEGTPSGVEDHFGVIFDLPAGGPTKGAPNAVDAIRVGRCDLKYEFGTTPDPESTFDLAVTDTGDLANRLGLIQERSGAFYCSGLHQFGTATNAVEFDDNSKTLFWNDHPAVTAPFNTVEISNASSIITMTNIAWKALGAKSPGTWITTDDATVNLNTCSFTDWGNMTFDSNTSALGCTFLGCDTVAAGEADMLGSSFLLSTAATNAEALLWAETLGAPATIAELDDTTYEQGTNAHHAITFSADVDEDVTLTGLDFTGFANGDDDDGSVFKFLDTGATFNLNLVGCTTDDTFSIDTRAGATVTLVINPVTLTVNVTNEAGDAIENARVFLETSELGDEMFEAATDTLVQAAGTATCTTSAVHGLVNGDKMVIRGAQPDGYNRVASVTVSSTTVFTYAVDSGLDASATGTPIVSFVPIQGLTNPSGVASGTRTWTSAQTVDGYARLKNPSEPFYADGNIAFDVDNTNGNTVNVTLQDDD